MMLDGEWGTIYSFTSKDGKRVYLEQAPADLPKFEKINTDKKLEQVLSKLESWTEFDVFLCQQLSNGRPLEVITMRLIQNYDLVDKLKLSKQKVEAFLNRLEGTYAAHPYHNGCHVADVVQALAVALAKDAWSSVLTDLELLAIIVASAMHDAGHPGVNNAFHTKSKSGAAAKYGPCSVNEYLHIARGYELLQMVEYNFLEHLSQEDYRYFSRLVEDMILGTDMQKHDELLSTFEDCLAGLGSDLNDWPQDKKCIAFQIMIHCIDISNPGRPFPYCVKWGERIQDELFQQGDLEKVYGFDVADACNEDKVTAGICQVYFIQHYLVPLLILLKPFAPNLVAELEPRAHEALRYWEQRNSM